MKKPLISILCISWVLVLIILPGCNSSDKENDDRDHFVNKLELENYGQISKYDAELITTHSLNDLKILSSSSERVSIDFSKQPVIFSAFWCPACQRELVFLRDNKEQLDTVPIIISTGFEDKTLEEAVTITKQELDELQIKGFEVYYALNDPEPKDVPKYPGLVFSKDGSLYRLSGEHTGDVIMQALNN
ncbi:hypothetical protein UNSWDHB_1918 [Dehalobacter sp. UNSWDHB]|uniref:TlpA family protein disulfide reductase n=1 Tax=Dehalobacter sp. UNSWDHB TaxID=1339256 RepID=UPI00038D1ACD|nr:hypothetical protein [Dehalobacter sp. UNSWDHB]EQB20845.1 hypothetical protein UNSWDHB_1918 [Dehalobacter sp. UNSWDHB]